MRTFCELVAVEFLPAIRALITKELLMTHRLTQTQIAQKMQITQPAVSYYARELRGTKVKILEKNERVMSFVKEISSSLANGGTKPVEIHDLCEKLVKENILHGSGLQKCSVCKC